jgi:hypothetical protein
MTEEELDSFSEQLGDGIGAPAKRRREVERMSAAEMEAEAEKVQEEIKRRKGRRGKPAAAGVDALMPLRSSS